MKKINLFFILFPLLCLSQPLHNKKVVGYYAQWAIYARNFNVWNVDAQKLTHLNYSFFGVSYDPANPGATALLSLDPYADFDHNEGRHAWDAPYKGNFADLKKLKELNPHLKVLISVGGWTKSHNFPAVCANPVARQALVNSMAAMMVTYPWIDGFDIDWEYPVVGGTDGSELLNGVALPAQPHTSDDHKNFVSLLKDMRTTFPNGKLVTAALGNNVAAVPDQYIGNNNKARFGLVDDISTYCDYVTYFGYDFGGNWNDKTAYNAPLYGSGNSADALHNADPTLVQSLDVLTNKFLNDVGIPPNKLIMGLPFYGKLFKNVARGSTPVAGMPGLFVSAPRDNVSSCTSPQPPQGTWDVANCEYSGSIEYCDLAGGVGTTIHNYLNTDGTVKPSAALAGWVRHWDDTCKVPYLYNNNLNQFISYDDQQSIREKVNYINSKGLAGGMIWELSQDERASNALLSTINTSFTSTPVSFTLKFKSPTGLPIQGVQATLTRVSNGLSEVLTSNANGEIVFLNKASLTQYTIVYSSAGNFFSPSSITVGQSNNSNQTYDVIVSNRVSNLSGSVRNASNTLITNVTVKLINTADNSEVASYFSPDGNFAFSNVINGLNYVLKGDKQFYTFTDNAITNLAASASNIVIRGALATYSISGNVYNGSQNFSGVLITLTGGAQTLTATTNSNGVYLFSNLASGVDYTITPSFSGQNFQPSNFVVNQLSQNVTQNFNANNYLVSGTVKNGSVPVAGAIVEMVLPWSGNSSPHVVLTATTDSQGKYNFSNSTFAGYSTITSLKLNSWQNNSVSYYPTDYGSTPVPTTSTTFNFNSQPQAIEFSFVNPTSNNSNISIAYGTPLVIESRANMLINDGTNITSVIYTISGTNYTASNTTGNNYAYIFNFPSSLYNQPIQILATVTASNGSTYTETITTTILCTGANCPNVRPILSWVDPITTSINQAAGLIPITIKVSATDTDGSIANVSISMNGGSSQNMTLISGYYTYTFTPTSYSQYLFNITATDNQGGSATLSKTLTIVNSVFTPLPSGKINLGYAHSWENSSAPFLYFRDMITKKYNVVAYSFIETVNGDGFTPQLTINTNRYLTNGTFNPQLLKNDINSLKALGIPVIVSIGGQNGHVELTTAQQKNIFVQGCKTIIDEYGFDGIDLDFEGGSMNFGAGALTNFSYSSISAYPKLKNVVDAFKEIKAHYGNGFIITCAPETFYVQVGYSTYSTTAGSFLPVIDNLRNELDLVMVQLYNTGSITALDGRAYSQATPDFLVSMTDMLITGFNVASTGYHFNGLPASKVIVGIPSCPSAAPAGGYIQPLEAKKALDYLQFGTNFTGRAYTLRNGAQPNLRGVMTWSINWDVSPCGSNEFGNFYSNYFNTALSTNQEELSLFKVSVYANNNIIIVDSEDLIEEISIFDLSGKNIVKIDNISKNNFAIETGGFSSGIYIVTVKTSMNKVYRKKLIIK